MKQYALEDWFQSKDVDKKDINNNNKEFYENLYNKFKAEGKEYAERLQAAGVPVKFVEYKGMVHVFIQMPKLLAATRKAQALIASELRTTFSIDGLVRSRAKTKA
jgi:acetyl esterase/lipase